MNDLGPRANANFIEFLQTIKPNPLVLDLNYEILLDEFESKFKSDRSELDKIDQEISRNNQRIQNAQHLMLDVELDAKDYKEIKLKMEMNNDRLI